MPRSDSTRPLFWLVLVIKFGSVFNGFACLSNPCLHGVCLDDLNSTYFCYCIDGYTGLQCQTNWNDCWSSPCQNGGVCVDGIASFNCTCPAGYVGDLCEEDFNECESNPCWNNGTCIDGPNGYVCQCLPGYSGSHCQIDIAVCNTTEETRCLNGGICTEGPGDTFSCKCQPGWNGLICDREIDECMSAPCQNGAICIDLHADYECACLFGYTGQNCEEVMQICDRNPCKNGALCLFEDNHHTCYCVPDFHGELCELQYDECQLGPRCLNGGTCIDGIDNFTCSCPPNLTGVLCECLILTDNDLDCTYISPTTTILYQNISTTTTPIFDVTTISRSLSTETTTQVPNINVTTPQSTTTPWCVPPVNETTKTTSEAGLTTAVYSTHPETTTQITTTQVTTETGQTSTITTTMQSTTESTVTVTTETPYTSTTEFPISTETTTIYVTKPSAYNNQTTTTIFTTTTSSESTSTTEALETTEKRETTITSTTADVYSTTTVGTTDSYFLNDTLTTSLSTITPTTMIPSSTSIEIKTTAMTDRWFTLESSETTPVYSTTEETVTTVIPKETTTTTIPTTISTFFTEEPRSDKTVTQYSMFTTPDTTTIISIDCTLPEKRCQNGGTCIYIDDIHKCLCPFDAEGLYCEIKLGVKNAAFNGNSYLTHRLPNIKNVSVEVTAKTLSTSGILFYATLDKTYMVLYVENGYLVFKFSCGYQTMLLSELNVPVNNGFQMKINAMLEFSNNYTHCDAAVRVNDTLSMRGDQMAKITQFVTQSAWLHLGGVPSNLGNPNVPMNGFVGCMSNLHIHGKKVYIYKDAENGYEISECASLACLSNPCQNGASCISVGDKWNCRCRNGFLGEMCEISICDDNPCLYGGTCIPFSSSGYLCLCPYGKHGHFCENDLKIMEPYFSSTVRGLSSFVAYSLPEGISHSMEIKFRFVPTTLEQIALLLFMGQNGQHDFYSDHLAVSFVKGYIMLTWNMGSGPRRIFTSQPVEKGASDYLVQLGYSGRRAWLYVDNLGNVTGRSPGNSVQLDIMPFLYLGGHESRNFSNLPHDLPFHTGFSGCIFELEIKLGNIILPLHGALKAVGRSVGQCGTTECYDRSCQNGGACLHHGNTFMCLCQDNWYGPLCSSMTNLCDRNVTKCSKESRCVPLLTDYECDCPLGQTGKYCQKDEVITDISFTGIRSYVRTRYVDIDNSKFNIELEIRALKDNGLIFYVGNKESGFVSLSLQDGLLELKLHSGKSRLNVEDSLTVRSSKLLLKGVWHKVQFGIFGRKVYLYVDHIINMGILEHGFLMSISSNNIYLGGIPDMSQLPISSTSYLPEPFTGCLRRLSLDQETILLIPENILDARNVGDCDGTPCGGESCLNGGTCWLDSFLKPHCSCIEPYYGERCDMVSQCTDKSCKNGICQNSTCYCHIGFEGGTCETKIEIKKPAFTGQSYIIVKKLRDKKRNIKDLDLKNVYLNFTTAKNDGLLLWTKKLNYYFGMGFENGFLKLVYSSKDGKKKIIEVPPYYKVSDGLWHKIDLHFVPFSLQIDGKTIKTSNEDAVREISHALNGEIFIGGLSLNVSVDSETKGLFHNNFEGCLDSLGTNAGAIITEYSKFEGLNINTCPSVLQNNGI
ncbi:eyes shut [Rhynchophorus ferrugineus]|uniref:eyes shut n=1 Tax=Rhynchophorus ferrugineus TaxID=354439 RepID=UPI003FCCFCF3